MNVLVNRQLGSWLDCQKACVSLNWRDRDLDNAIMIMGGVMALTAIAVAIISKVKNCNNKNNLENVQLLINSGTASKLSPKKVLAESVKVGFLIGTTAILTIAMRLFFENPNIVQAYCTDVCNKC